MLKRNILREIKKSFGRYIAIFAIVALGVGFFSGLKVCQDAMISTGDDYLKSVAFFDFQGISTLGFDDESIDELNSLDYVSKAEGSYTLDVLFDISDDNDLIMKTMSLPDEINLPLLTSGRMPEASNECVLDYKWLDIDNMVGKVIRVSSANDEDVIDTLPDKEYTIVGTVNSPLYLNYERGTTSIGSGTVSGFVYLPKESFDSDVYSMAYTLVGEYETIYSDEYKAKIEAVEKDMEDAFEKIADKRYDRLYDEYVEEYNKEVAEKRQEVIDTALEEAGDLSMYGPMADTVKEQIIKEAGEAFDEEVGEMPDPPFDEPKVYVLDRDTNTGYVCFESDTSIIDSIAKVFPIFFFLVAALVCITSMTRMVDEHRTQIGLLKAMGYSTNAILSTFLFYSGSASIVGGLLGFLTGSVLFPHVIWRAYTMMYDFSDSVNFILDYKLGLLTISAALLCVVGATLFSCLNDTKEVPAELIRHKSPDPGKRIFLERIGFIWNRFSFLRKVSLRNIFRYKKRFLMMLVGVSGCTALLVAGFGINDSIGHIADYQYSEISLYDYSIVFEEGIAKADEEAIIDELKETGNAKSVMFCEQLSMNHYDSAANPLRLIVTDFENINTFIDLHFGEVPSETPGLGGILVSESFASKHDIKIGDTLKLQDDDMNIAEFTVSGICENYIFNYGYVTPETFEAAMGRKPKNNTSFVVTDLPKSGEEGFVSDGDRETELNRAAAKVREMDNVSSVALADEFRHRIDTMMTSLNAIVYLVIASAAALAFIVIYNLTNINITERIREIATIKVLGFYPNETSAYVYRENMLLTGISGILGLFLGRILLSYIIGEIKVDMIFFPTRITPTGYILSYLLTFVFAGIVMLALYRKLDKISMTESLKTVE